MAGKPQDGASMTVTMSFSKGMDRAASPIFLESIREAITTFPFVQTSLLLAINVIDDYLGFLTKRPGTQAYLDNPDNQPVQAIIPFVDASFNAFQFRNSGTKWYRYAFSGNSWGSAIYTQTANNKRPSFDFLGGFMFTANGIDPLLAFNGTGVWQVANNSVSTALTANMLATDTTATVTSTASFPSYGFIKIDNEIMQYFGPNTSTLFEGLVRGYAGTTPATHSSAATVYVYYGNNVPTTPSYCVQFQGRLYCISQGGQLQWSGAHGEVTDQYNWNLNPTPANGDESYSGVSYIGLYDGDVVKSMDVIDNRLVITKYRNMYIVAPDSAGIPYQTIPVSTIYGTTSHQSVQQVDNWLVYFNPIGVHAYNGVKPLLISKSVDDLIKGIPTANYQNIVSGTYQYKYYMSVGSTTSSDRYGNQTYSNAVLLYNYLTENWFMYQYPFTVNCMNVMFNSDGITESLYFGDTLGQCYVQVDDGKTYSDNGANIDVAVQTRFFLFNKTDRTKEYGKFTVNGENMENGSVSFAFIGDNEITDFDWTAQLNRYFYRDFMPGDISSYYRGISYLFKESSIGRFMIEAMVQDFVFGEKDSK